MIFKKPEFRELVKKAGLSLRCSQAINGHQDRSKATQNTSHRSLSPGHPQSLCHCCSFLKTFTPRCRP